MFGSFGEMASILKNLGDIQKNMKKMKEELAAAVIAGKDPTGKVTVEISGVLQARSVHIDPSLLAPENAHLLEAASNAAVQNAMDQFKQLAQQKFSEATGGLKLPGLN